jgi:hypothetical protein
MEQNNITDEEFEKLVLLFISSTESAGLVFEMLRGQRHLKTLFLRHLIRYCYGKAWGDGYCRVDNSMFSGVVPGCYWKYYVPSIQNITLAHTGQRDMVAEMTLRVNCKSPEVNKPIGTQRAYFFEIIFFMDFEKGDFFGKNYKDVWFGESSLKFDHPYQLRLGHVSSIEKFLDYIENPPTITNL